HGEEVTGVGEVVVRVDVGEAAAVAVSEGCDGRHLADQPPRLHPPRLEVHDVLRLGVEGGERADRADQDAHRMGVVAEALDELLQVLVHQGVHLDVALPHAEVRGGGQLALDDQVGGLEEAALLGQLLDRVAAVAEDAALAVDVADLALAGGRVEERGVVADDLEPPELDGPDGAARGLLAARGGGRAGKPYRRPQPGEARYPPARRPRARRRAGHLALEGARRAPGRRPPLPRGGRDQAARRAARAGGAPALGAGAGLPGRRRPARGAAQPWRAAQRRMKRTTPPSAQRTVPTSVAPEPSVRG